MTIFAIHKTIADFLLFDKIMVSSNQIPYYKIIVKTLAGLEQSLADELGLLGAVDMRILKRGVSLSGDLAMVLKINYLSRLALRVLVVIDEFMISNSEEYYNRIKDHPWEKFLDKKGKFAVDGFTHNSIFTNSHYAELKAKDAIADYFREKTGTRPNVDVQHPDTRINIHIAENQCTLSLDSSGNSLHLRGYRIANVSAPLNEVLAAGLIALSGWNGATNFIDPMCGSGTLLTEAAMKSMNIPAGYYRKDYGFMHWPDFKEKEWTELKDKCNSLITENEIEITGVEILPENYKAAVANIKQAGLQHDVRIQNSSFEKLKVIPGNGTLITNPPYGERLQSQSLEELYRKLGDWLKNNIAGYKAWIISSDKELVKNIGLKPFKKYHLFNGSIEAVYMGFELFNGSRKDYVKNNLNQ